MVYYEVEHNAKTHEFATIEEAIEFADANECEVIAEIGGSWDEFKKCWFCGDWFTVGELISTGVCARCAQAIESHEGRQQ